MNDRPRFFAKWSLLALAICLGGCSSQAPHAVAPSSLLSKIPGRSITEKFRWPFSKKQKITEQYEELSVAQQADIELSIARSMEQQKDVADPIAAYRDVLKRQPNHPVATHRLAVLTDRQGNHEASAPLFLRALELSPENAEIFCDLGYSMYLQDRWSEAEMNLRQSIALDPDNHRAHNNLGLVLAHQGKTNASLVEFRQAGCTSTDAYMNLAYVQMLNENWTESRRHYGLALQADPASEKAKIRLEKLESLITKVQALAQAESDTRSLSSVIRLPPVSAVAQRSAAVETSVANVALTTGPRGAKIAAEMTAAKPSLGQAAAKLPSKSPVQKVSWRQPAASAATVQPESRALARPAPQVVPEKLSVAKRTPAKLLQTFGLKRTAADAWATDTKPTQANEPSRRPESTNSPDRSRRTSEIQFK